MTGMGGQFFVALSAVQDRAGAVPRVRRVQTSRPRLRGHGTCGHCRRPFEVRRYQQRFCSRTCNGLFSPHQAYLRRMVGAACAVPWRPCIGCGLGFIRRTKGRICAACQPRAVELRSWGGPKPLKTIICRHCGASFTPGYENKRRVFCSPECAERRRYGDLSNTELTRRRSAKRIRRLRPRILERYEGRCGPCGQPIDLELPWLHPLSLTVDHITPISAGGGDAIENLWPAHRRCNEEKSDDLGWRPGSALFGTPGAVA